MALQGASSSLRSSSSSVHPCTHDTFLSFRGGDVCQKFISHLYHALNKRGINTYIDDGLKRGEEISQALFQAIEGSMTSIIVLSKNYAESRSCLNELLKILECMETVKQSVLPVFHDVDPSEVINQKGSFGEAFAKLKDRFEGNEKVLKWKAALEKLANMSRVKLKNYRKESEFIEVIIQWVELRLVNETPLNVAKYPVGIECRKRDIYQLLSIERNDIIRIVGIFGTGGIGSCFLSNIREISKQAGDLIQLQNTLLFDILGTSLDVRDINKGINVIKHRLHSKRVLLILDDVDELVQIENYRIIITTRYQGLLDAKVDSKRELKLLDGNEALRLFSLHAVGKDEPSDKYVDLAKRAIKYAKGLPLALAVLGSYLKGKSTHQWKSALNKYKNIPNRNIQKVFLVSYEGLDNNEKEMFVDIACFFKGKPLPNIMNIFDSCDKCLITIEGGFVWMHDLLQDMGREIVRLESPNEPGQHSRLFFHEDVRHVLEESMGTNKVVGMIIEMPKGEDVIKLNSEAFVQMKRLRVLINHNASFSSGPNYLSNELRVLDWFEYPLQSLPPNFRGNKLIIFKMRGGFIRELSFIKFKNMTIMKFNDCDFLTKVPDVSSIPNLKELIVKRCTNLVQVHNSVGSLDLKLRSLHSLDLGHCSSFRRFPEIGCEMKSLTRLILSCTAVEELPLSIGNLTRLDELFLHGCKNLKHLPINIILQLQHFEKQLQELVPPTNSSNGSSALQVLNRQNCFQLESNFFPISCFFTMFDSSTTLTYLDLSGSEFVSLPTSIKGFVALIELDLRDCEKLEEILELPPNIELVDAKGCNLLERFPKVSRILEFNGSHIKSLQGIVLNGCDKMHEKIWNYKGHAAVLPKNEIPEWLWYQKEFLENEIAKREDDDVQLKGNEEWVINIEGPHHLEDISGIVIYLVTFFKEDYNAEYFVPNVEITSISSNCVCRIDSEKGLLLYGHDVTKSIVGQYEVWMWYSDLESFEVKVLDNLRVQVRVLPNPSDPLWERVWSRSYISMGANVVYRHESRAHKRRKMD
ncbi:hypothetical protein I3760_15G102700 [Carya illinoinensis]|nr:hypothetical protein I3760_15G102700 [Carya illinoinensis]